MRKLRGSLVAIALLAGCAAGSDGPVSYQARDLATGDVVSVESLRGRPTLLVTWTTWCRECDEELAGLAEFADSPAADGLEVVAVNLDAAEVTAEIEAKVAAHHLTTALWRDRRNDFKRAFGALGVPTSVLLDADGAVVGTFQGAVDFDAAEVIAALEAVRELGSS